MDFHCVRGTLEGARGWPLFQIDMEPEDYEYFSDDSFRVYDLNEDQFKFDEQPSDSLASNLLELASLQFSVHTLESALGNSDSQYSGEYEMLSLTLGLKNDS